METPFMPKGIKGFQKGHSVPDHVRKIVADLQRGKVASLETRLKMSKSLTGRKGKPMSLENRQKMRERRLGTKLSPETIAKILVSRKGYKHSEKTKRKISAANRKEVIKTDESKIWRRRFEYKNWRKAVYERDDFTCQYCYKKGGTLHPHHIRNFAEAKELRFIVDNGITLCVSDHRLFHKLYGRINNNRIQIDDFIKKIWHSVYQRT